MSTGLTDHKPEQERKLIEAALNEVFRVLDDEATTAFYPETVSLPPPDTFEGFRIVREIHRGAQGAGS